MAIYIAGEALGSIGQILIADYLGRIRFMQLAAIVVTVGCTIQTASMNLGMFLAGRCIAGIGVGYVCLPLFSTKNISALTVTDDSYTAH